MKKKTTLVIATLVALAGIAAALGVRSALNKPKEEQHAQQAHCAVDTGEKPAKVERTTGPMNLGRIMGEVVQEKPNDLYFLQVRGARLPFKASPLQAQSVDLQAPGQKPLEKNTALLYALMGKEVEGAALLINPEEEDQVTPAAQDIARYVRVANPRKFAGVAYTKSGGKFASAGSSTTTIQALAQQHGIQIAETQPTETSAIRTLGQGTAQRPLIQLKGPKSGATRTGVSVVRPGQILVEGKTYEDLYTAADYIGITLLKMLCGSSECPDAAACATGGKCGCG